MASQNSPAATSFATSAHPPSAHRRHCEDQRRGWDLIYIYIWEFPKIGVPYFGSPYNKEPTIEGTILGSLFSETPICTHTHTIRRYLGATTACLQHGHVRQFMDVISVSFRLSTTDRTLR